jgi:hypothetical protein
MAASTVDPALVKRMLRILRRFEKQYPIFADKDSVPEDPAIEMEVTWGDIWEIRDILRSAGPT